MVTFSKLGARKELGGITHRINEVELSGALRHQLIARHLDNLADTLPAKYQGIINQLKIANYNDPLELVAGVSLLQNMIPITYGCVLQGQLFTIDGVLWRKNKLGLVEPHTGAIFRHIDASTVVKLVNE